MENNQFENLLSDAKLLDEQDCLKEYRNRFYFPKVNGKETLYLLGNSLGLQPKSARKYVEQQMDKWAKEGIYGYHGGQNPWLNTHQTTQDALSKLIGSKKDEVVATGTLTANIHSLMVSFYRPTKERFKILIQNRPFPSDRYALASQIKFHGYSEAESIIEMKPRQGQCNLRTQDILAMIQKHKHELALVYFGGINFYTGQLFDIKAITEEAHKIGVECGIDLAHAIGNVPLQLHDWGVDFACWCGYKYLNSGPGGLGGIYVNEKHHKNDQLPKLHSWWGNNQKNRFQMSDKFESSETVESWLLSNAPVITSAVFRASLQIFSETGIKVLREKSIKLTGFLEKLLNQQKKQKKLEFELITPENPQQRGCQLSLIFEKNGRSIYDKLQKLGVVTDWREPSVIRVAPVPLYNSFMDVWNFVNHLVQISEEIKKSANN